MEGENSSWLHLAAIVGHFPSLIEYYFNAVFYYGGWFRQVGHGLLYSVGLAWAGFCFLKAPVDRLLAGLSVVGMIVLAGFLMSPTTNTKNLGRASGAELTIGAYYSFVIAGTITQSFNEVIESSWRASLSDSAGNTIGPTKDAIQLAFNDMSNEFADKFIGNKEGREAYIDYMHQCGSEALKFARTEEDKENLSSIGIGSNTLGLSAIDATEYAQRLKANTWRIPFITPDDPLSDPRKLYVAEREAAFLEQKRNKALEFLAELPASNSKIDGTKGYRIPTSDFYKREFSKNNSSSSTSNDIYKPISESSGELATMLAPGLESVQPGSEEDYVFYPTNCSQLYQVASSVMSNFREGVKGVDGMEDLDKTKAYANLASANRVREAAIQYVNGQYKAAGSDIEEENSWWDKAKDSVFSSSSSLGNEFNEMMLEFLIPNMIAMMAMLVAVLLVTFPIFALTSVIFGHGVLITYFKLMALPFIVVFANNLILSFSASFIAFNKEFVALDNTFKPGGVDMAGALSMMNTETIVFSLICFCELAIAKFILWDDVKAVTSFSPGAAATSSAARGVGIASSAIALASGVIGKGMRMTKAASTAKNAQGMSSTLTAINKSVSHIANSGPRSKASNGTSTLGGSGTGGNGSKPNNPGGNQGGPSGPPPCVPPPQNKT